MAAQGFARLKPKGASKVPNGEKAPTVRDKAQSDVHHADSVRYNLAHAMAHTQEAQKHASKLTDLMSRAPATAPHVRALQGALDPDAATESGEPGDSPLEEMQEMGGVPAAPPGAMPAAMPPMAGRGVRRGR